MTSGRLWRSLPVTRPRLDEPGDYSMRYAWLMEVATILLRADVERGLRLMADWHIETYDPGMGAIVKWAAANPRRAARGVTETVDLPEPRRARSLEALAPR